MKKTFVFVLGLLLFVCSVGAAVKPSLVLGDMNFQKYYELGIKLTDDSTVKAGPFSVAISGGAWLRPHLLDCVVEDKAEKKTFEYEEYSAKIMFAQVFASFFKARTGYEYRYLNNDSKLGLDQYHTVYTGLNFFPSDSLDMDLELKFAINHYIQSTFYVTYLYNLADVESSKIGNVNFAIKARTLGSFFYIFDDGTGIERIFAFDLSNKVRGIDRDIYCHENLPTTEEISYFAGAQVDFRIRFKTFDVWKLHLTPTVVFFADCAYTGQWLASTGHQIALDVGEFQLGYEGSFVLSGHVPNESLYRGKFMVFYNF